jgi:hypothetical protein
MPFKRVNTIPFDSGQQSRPLLIDEVDAMTHLKLVLSGWLVVSSRLTLSEDNILRLLHRIQLEWGGKTIKTYGDNGAIGSAGKFLYYKQQTDEGVLPQFTAPGTAVATHPFVAELSIPFVLPKKLYASLKEGERNAYAMKTDERELNLIVDWGSLSDVFSAGAATASAIQLEVIAVTNPGLNKRLNNMRNKGSRFLIIEHLQSPNVQAGATTEEQHPMDRKGVLLYTFCMGFDNGVRDHANFNRLTYKVNNSDTWSDASVDAFRARAKETAGLQATALPTGIIPVYHDNELNGDNGIPLTDVQKIKSFGLTLNHDALTGTFRLFHHHVYIEKVQ